MKDLEIKGKIIKALRASRMDFVSGEEISSSLGFSRASLWKYINKLREDGYEIKASPHRGYSLKASPDKLYAHEISADLKTRSLGRKYIYHHEKVSSTNDLAYMLAEDNAPEGTVVVAESQTKGRGRMARQWVSPRGGGIYMSVILRPDAEADEMPAITLIAASAIARSLKNVCGINVGVKWPNDIFLRDKKLCGILTEIKAQPDSVDFLVLGIGMNVNTPSDKLPPCATSLKEHIGESVRRVELVRRMLKDLEDVYSVFGKSGFQALRDECRELSSVLGKKVNVVEHKRRITGTAKDIDEKGALIVQCDSGRVERVFSGDVLLCR